MTTWGVVTDIGGRSTATVFAWNNAIATSGAIAAPIMYGAIAEHVSWRWVFITGAIAYLAANPFIEQLWHQGLSDNFPPRYQAQIEELLTLATAALAENKTHRLSDDFLDLDLLDQQARDVLGMVRADEVVIR